MSDTLRYNSPSDIFPFTLAINEKFVQSYINYEENFLTGEPIPQYQHSEGKTFLGIEEITLPAGSFSACKIEYSSFIAGQSEGYTYVWFIASGPYRGMFAKFYDREGWVTEASRFAINGK